jgi:hypothetical protein
VSRSAESAVGRIPFRIRIGVTGHRDLESSAALVDVPDRVRRLVPRSSTTSVRVGVVSALAEGADRLVVDEVFHHAAALGEQARLEVVLPFPRERYVDEQEFSQRAEDEFDKWLSRSESVMEVGATWKPEQGDRAYEAASHLVVARSDVLVALWDGKPSRGPGGTADTLLFAAELGKPCVWVPTDGVAEPYDNFKPGSATAFLADVRKRAAASDSEEGADDASERSVAATLAGAFAELDEFNRTPLPPLPHLRRRIERELGTTDAVEDWIALPFARAATLADQFQSRFMLATWLIAALATGAAAALAVSVTQEHPSQAWAWAEVSALVSLFLLFVLVHLAGLHRRWLSYRLLAERFRSAFFIAPVGIDFQRGAGLEAAFVERRSADWLQRGVEEVWESRPREPTPLDMETLRRRLADRWIGSQISYHARACRQHERHGRVLTSLILVCFFGTVAFAFLHALTKRWEELSVVLTITLPVAAAAIGGVLTVRQHRALADRYTRMHADLVAVRRSLLRADAKTIGRATQEAARVVAEENGDWLGAMWFLDLEHPA